MKLAENIIAYGIKRPPEYEGDARAWKAKEAEYKTRIRNAQLILADNVSEYFYSYDTYMQEWDLKKDLPNLAPPFESFFIEYDEHIGKLWEELCRRCNALSNEIIERSEALLNKYAEAMREHPHLTEELRPGMQNIIEKIAVERQRISDPQDNKRNLKIRTGVLFTATELKETDSIITLCEVWEMSDEQLRDLLRGGGWVVQASVFIQHGKANIEGPVIQFEYVIDAQGRTISDTPIRFTSESIYSEFQAQKKAFIVPALLTICFMHCRKQVVVEQRGPLVKNCIIRKKHKVPDLIYHILIIEPIKRLLEGDDSLTAQPSSLKHRLHLCRGHFIHYTADAPLFGKYVGTYWRDMHLRGREDKGRVDKAYKVKAPASES
jgi:hypothetical protein